MNYRKALRHPGVLSALAAALLFGAATPLAKSLLLVVDPWLLAGLLYLGSGLGLSVYRLAIRAPAVVLPAAERNWFAGAVFCGGIVGPVLLMFGLSAASAADAALLLNAESVFTALLAWFIFKENFDRRIALGMAAIVAGALVLSWPGEASLALAWPALAILGAGLAWGLDNNLTRKVSLRDASWIAAIKGLVAGVVNLGLALAFGATLPAAASTAAALLLGFLSYGISLVLFVLALRQLGSARTGAYFSLAPFFGAVLALLLGAPLTPPLLLAGLLMAVGVWLHLGEEHSHPHTHERLEHCHQHRHDEHHTHQHDADAPPGEPHSHRHVHEALTHTHPHYPDAHHPHRH